MVMGIVDKHYIGDVNETKLVKDTALTSEISSQPESVDSFAVELKTLDKTCNFCDCLRDSLIRDLIVLGIAYTKHHKLLLGFFETIKLLSSVLRDFSIRRREIKFGLSLISIQSTFSFPTGACKV